MSTEHLLAQIRQILKNKPDLSEIAEPELQKLLADLEQTENSLKLKTINELQGKSFFVDSYQRGYKWKTQQVTELLNDIDEFQPEQDSNFYCLQPVVVKRKTLETANGDNYYWELIDGQQRMTTIFIILSYLNKAQYFSLRYETRPSSTKDLNRLAELTEAEISTIDAEYFYRAYQAVKTWFENKEPTFEVEKWKNKLLNHTKVIWYAVCADQRQDSKKQSIDIFTRLNQGKIPLTDAELIKALFLQNIAKAYSNNDIAIQKQTEMAHQWDSIEQSLQNEEFWAFLSPGQKTNIHTRIELIFDLIVGKKINKQWDVGHEEHKTFSYYAEIFRSSADCVATIEEKWLDVLTGFQYLNEWFENDRLYHLIGYLIGQEYKTIQDIWKATEGCKRDKFEAKLREFIKAEISVLFKKNKQDNELDFDHIYYDVNDSLCRQKIKSLLVLFNIYRYERHSTRFSFKRYHRVKWDIEHIHAQQSEALSNKDQMTVWLAEQKMILDDVILANLPDANLKEKLKALLNEYEISKDKSQKDAVYTAYNNTLKLAMGDTFEDIQTIDNLCLLPEKDNRSIGKNSFSIKRLKIMQAEKEWYESDQHSGDNFIPLASQQVFSKFFSSDVSNMLKWDKTNRKDYRHALIACFKQYGLEFQNENLGAK